MIMMDFELAALNSAKSAFPNISIKGCIFHLIQSLWRKLQELDLSAQYRNPEGISIRNSIHRFMALAFRPENEIVLVFKAISAAASTQLDAFINYFGRSHIGVYKNSDNEWIDVVPGFEISR
jgi:hypothetical protein